MVALKDVPSTKYLLEFGYDDGDIWTTVVLVKILVKISLSKLKGKYDVLTSPHYRAAGGGAE